MKIWIPTVGDKIRLTEDWTFELWQESRNVDLYDFVEPPTPLFYNVPRGMMTIPAGTVLRVDRIYIRGSARKFDSMTFRTVISPDRRLSSTKHKGEGSRRFWAKLADVNNIVAEDASEVP